MSYSKLYFSKEIEELQYSDIENFFAIERNESDKIEFKSYYSKEENNHTEKENGVIRAICALLNSEGGIIIWGSPIGVKVEGKKEKVFKGALSYCEKLIEKDRFISKLTDLITPSPSGIKFQPLEKEGKYVYIIEVEKSFYSPHQYRNTYYMRIDGQTKPAPHHFIEALMKKITFPRLEGYLKFENITDDRFGHFLLYVTPYIFNKSKLQNEFEINYRLITSIGTFAGYNPHQYNEIYHHQGHELRILNAKSVLYYNEPFCSQSIITIPKKELEESNYEIELFLHFGGKSSPLMISNYKLKLFNFEPYDLNKSLTFIEENKYSYEQTDNMNINEKEKLKLLLGR